MPGHFLHSVQSGSPNLSSSIGFHWAAHGKKEPSVRHVTNGTHGFVHTLSRSISKNRSKRRTGSIGKTGSHTKPPTETKGSAHSHHAPKAKSSAKGRKEKRAILSDGVDSFSYGDLNGVKLSYMHPCQKSYGKVSESDLVNWSSAFVRSFLQNGADKYALQMQLNGNLVLWGSLIVEQNGFGQNFEGIDFRPTTSCRDEL